MRSPESPTFTAEANETIDKLAVEFSGFGEEVMDLLQTMKYEIAKKRFLLLKQHLDPKAVQRSKFLKGIQDFVEEVEKRTRVIMEREGTDDASVLRQLKQKYGSSPSIDILSPGK